MPHRNPLNRSLVQGIQDLGFRRWYERELLSSHAHMALALLATVAMLASFEALRGASMSEKLMNTLFILGCGAVAVWAMRRYLFLLMHAESLANQANCPHCQAYGRFQLGEAGNQREGDEVPVRCTRCGHRWTLRDE